MNEMETPAVESETVPVPGPGAMLRMARESRGATIAEVAAALKMRPRQIEAIENEDFSRLSGATFVRGFIRNYAKFLRIDAAAVLAALPDKAVQQEAGLSAPDDVRVKMPSPSGRQGKGLLGATALALVLLGVALVLYFDVIDLGGLLKQPGGRAAVEQAAQPAVAQPLPQTAAASSVPPAEGAPAEPRDAEGAGRQAPKAGAHLLIFSFDGNSWVEVKDAAGRTLLSQMNEKGTTQVVEGRPPFNLVVGNASHVRLQHNEQPVDLRPHTRVEVARLTLE